jgi:hypothetical protein
VRRATVRSGCGRFGVRELGCAEQAHLARHNRRRMPLATVLPRQHLLTGTGTCAYVPKSVEVPDAGPSELVGRWPGRARPWGDRRSHRSLMRRNPS